MPPRDPPGGPNKLRAARQQGGSPAKKKGPLSRLANLFGSDASASSSLASSASTPALSRPTSSAPSSAAVGRASSQENRKPLGPREREQPRGRSTSPVKRGANGAANGNGVVGGAKTESGSGSGASTPLSNGRQPSPTKSGLPSSHGPNQAHTSRPTHIPLPKSATTPSFPTSTPSSGNTPTAQYPERAISPTSTSYSFSPSLKADLMAAAAYASMSSPRDSWATNTSPGLAGVGVSLAKAVGSPVPGLAASGLGTSVGMSNTMGIATGAGGGQEKGRTIESVLGGNRPAPYPALAAPPGTAPPAPAAAPAPSAASAPAVPTARQPIPLQPVPPPVTRPPSRGQASQPPSPSKPSTQVHPPATTSNTQQQPLNQGTIAFPSYRNASTSSLVSPPASVRPRASSQGPLVGSHAPSGTGGGISGFPTYRNLSTSSLTSRPSGFTNYHMRPPTLSNASASSLPPAERPLVARLSHEARVERAQLAQVQARNMSVDKVDTLDGTDPWGGLWHHGSPYDVLEKTGNAIGGGRRAGGTGTGTATPKRAGTAPTGSASGRTSPVERARETAPTTNPYSRSRRNSAAPSPLARSTTASQVDLHSSTALASSAPASANPSSLTSPVSPPAPGGNSSDGHGPPPVSPPTAQQQARRSRISLDGPISGDLLATALEDAEDTERLFGELKLTGRGNGGRKKSLFGLGLFAAGSSNGAVQAREDPRQGKTVRRKLSKSGRRNSVVLSRRSSVSGPSGPAGVSGPVGMGGAETPGWGKRHSVIGVVGPASAQQPTAAAPAPGIDGLPQSQPPSQVAGRTSVDGLPRSATAQDFQRGRKLSGATVVKGVRDAFEGLRTPSPEKPQPAVPSTSGIPPAAASATTQAPQRRTPSPDKPQPPPPTSTTAASTAPAPAAANVAQIPQRRTPSPDKPQPAVPFPVPPSPAATFPSTASTTASTPVLLSPQTAASHMSEYFPALAQYVAGQGGSAEQLGNVSAPVVPHNAARTDPQVSHGASAPGTRVAVPLQPTTMGNGPAPNTQQGGRARVPSFEVVRPRKMSAGERKPVPALHPSTATGVTSPASTTIATASTTTPAVREEIGVTSSQAPGLTGTGSVAVPRNVHGGELPLTQNAHDRPAAPSTAATSAGRTASEGVDHEHITGIPHVTDNVTNTTAHSLPHSASTAAAIANGKQPVLLAKATTTSVPLKSSPESKKKERRASFFGSGKRASSTSRIPSGGTSSTVTTSSIVTATTANTTAGGLSSSGNSMHGSSAIHQPRRPDFPLVSSSAHTTPGKGYAQHSREPSLQTDGSTTGGFFKALGRALSIFPGGRTRKLSYNSTGGAGSSYAAPTPTRPTINTSGGSMGLGSMPGYLPNDRSESPDVELVPSMGRLMIANPDLSGADSEGSLGGSRTPGAGSPQREGSPATPQRVTGGPSMTELMVRANAQQFAASAPAASVSSPAQAASQSQPTQPIAFPSAPSTYATPLASPELPRSTHTRQRSTSNVEHTSPSTSPATAASPSASSSSPASNDQSKGRRRSGSFAAITGVGAGAGGIFGSFTRRQSTTRDGPSVQDAAKAAAAVTQPQAAPDARRVSMVQPALQQQPTVQHNPNQHQSSERENAALQHVQSQEAQVQHRPIAPHQPLTPQQPVQQQPQSALMQQHPVQPIDIPPRRPGQAPSAHHHTGADPTSEARSTQQATSPISAPGQAAPSTSGSSSSRPGVQPLTSADRSLSATSLRDLAPQVVVDVFHAPVKESPKSGKGKKEKEGEYHSSAIEYRKSFRREKKEGEQAGAMNVPPVPDVSMPWQPPLQPQMPVQVPQAMSPPQYMSPYMLPQAQHASWSHPGEMVRPPWASPPVPNPYGYPLPPPQQPYLTWSMSPNAIPPGALRRGLSTDSSVSGETIRGMGREWAVVSHPAPGSEQRPGLRRRESKDREETYQTLADMGSWGRSVLSAAAVGGADELGHVKHTGSEAEPNEAERKEREKKEKEKQRREADELERQRERAAEMVRKRSISQHVPVAKLRQMQREAEEERERLMRKDRETKAEGQSGLGLLRYRSRTTSSSTKGDHANGPELERKTSGATGRSAKGKEVERKSWDDRTAQELRERTEILTGAVTHPRETTAKPQDPAPVERNTGAAAAEEPRQRRISSESISRPRAMAPAASQYSRRERPPYVRKRSTSIDSVLSAAAQTSEYYGYGVRPHSEQPGHAYSPYPGGASTWSAHGAPRYTPVPASSLTSSRSNSQRLPNHAPGGDLRSRRLSTGSHGFERNMSQGPPQAPERPPIGGSNSSPSAVTRTASGKAGAGSGYTSFSISSGQENETSASNGRGSATTGANAAARRVIPAPNMDWMKFTDPAPSSSFVGPSYGAPGGYAPQPVRGAYYNNSGAFSSADYWKTFSRGVPPVAARDN